MSVRIYQLSKDLEMENKELLALLKERGYEVKSASSTISNIDAEALIKEMKPEKPEEEEKAEEVVEEKQEEEKPKKEEPKLPVGKFVKSADEIKTEKESKKEAPKVVMPQAKAAPTPPKPKAAPTPPPTPKASTPPPTPKATTPPPAPTPTPSTPPPTPSQPAKPAPVPAPEVSEESAAAGDQGDAKIITIKPPIVVRDFADMIGLKPFRLISELMEMGIFASMNQTIEESAAQKIAEKHGLLLEVKHRGEKEPEPEKKVEEKPKVDESKNLEPRPPVVCILGHVDHGKTTLLDTIRNANVVAGEAGGITQHVGAYQVEHNDHKITFIDTPGHAAFSKMRERGANVTDVAILVVAADDGFMPQTDQALKFAQDANVPVVVAINKADVKGANIDRVKQQMQERDIASEDWGGETLCASISALKGEGIDELLEAILLQAEILEIKANPKCAAEGVIIESQIEVGRGSTATAIVQKGTLKGGDALVCGHTYCKVRALMDDKNQKMKSAGPGTPVKLLGWSDAPEAGATFVKVKNDRAAKSEAADYEHNKKKQDAQDQSAKPVDIENLFSAIADSQQKTFSIILKGDVHGTVEALSECLKNDIKSDKIRLEIIHSDVGLISKNDIELASTSGAAVVAFNVKMDQGVQALAKQNATKIIQHNIIYELIDSVKEAMVDLLEPEKHENKIGAAEVRQVFNISNGLIAGCMVTEGKFLRDAFVRVHRKKDVIFTGKVGMLKRFQDDATEVRSGYECGIRVQNFNSFEEGDIIECFEIKEVQPAL